MKRISRIIKEYGIWGTFIKIMDKITFRIFNFFNKKVRRMEQKKLAKIRELNKAKYQFLNDKMLDPKYKYIFVFYPYSEWNLPIFQRSQQVALELSSRDDVLYFFCTANCHYDNLQDVYEEINPNLYLVTDYDFLISVKTRKRVIHLYSTDTISDYSIIEDAKNRADKILYEYIDEIHEEITHSLPSYYIEKHNQILKDESCYVIATADKLYNDVKSARKRNFALATNGVKIEDFIKNEEDNIPDDLLPIKEKYEKIICYYGALAVWFDYDLIKKVAKKYPKYAIVLIGLEYDESFKNSRINEIENVFYLGRKNYSDLHLYSENSDLLTIPFLVNEITESTSPVKLFEYMATKIPILTTDMKECRKYKSVIIGKNHNDFIKKIDSTIELINSKDYLEVEMSEAMDNTWKAKVNVIIDLIDSK